jgi:hypothetical protein
MCGAGAKIKTAASVALAAVRSGGASDLAANFWR